MVLRRDRALAAKKYIKVFATVTEELFVRMFKCSAAESAGRANRFAGRLIGHQPKFVARLLRGAWCGLRSGQTGITPPGRVVSVS
jgi:hypothetical protein